MINFFSEMNAISGEPIKTKPQLATHIQEFIKLKHRNNIYELDKLVPSLEMSEIIPQSAPLPEEGLPKWSEDVDSLLKNVDRPTYKLLQSLIPQYNANLTSGELVRAVNKITKVGAKERLIQAHSDFVKSMGHNVTVPPVTRQRVLVLGTSNSILKNGWIYGFREQCDAGVEIHNASIGGSPGSQFSYWCTQDLSSYDHIIFDAIVNDENMMQQGHLGCFDRYKELLRQIISTMAHNSHLTILGFCNERFAQKRSDIYKAYQEISNEVSADFHSVIDFALKADKPTFRDGAHISLDIACEFGRKLAQSLPEIPRKNSVAQSFSSSFKVIEVSSVSSAPTVVRENSMMRREFSMVKPGEVISFGPVGELIGMQIDSCATFCFFEAISSSGTTMHSVRYSPNLEKLLVFFIPFPHAAWVEELRIHELADHYTSSPHEEVLGDVPESRLSISHVVFWKGNQDTDCASTD